MTADAHLGTLIGHDQKGSIGVVMRTVTGRTLQLTVAIQLQLLGQSVGGADLGVFGCQHIRIDKTDRMVVRQISSKIGIPRCDIDTTGASISRMRQCDGAVMTTQAQ